MDYVKPEVSTLGNDWDDNLNREAWFYIEQVVYGIGYAVLTIVLTAIDLTP